jgi:flagellar basal-body rod protein FlgF
MTDIHQIAAIGMQQGKQRLEAIALNTAAASQPGYRRQMALPATFASALDAPATSRHVDTRAGGLQASGRALDIAIETDDAYFALSDGVGTWLTRAGAFHVDGQGRLIGERGLAVQGVGGPLQLAGADVTVRADGAIEHDGAVVGRLALFRAHEPGSLRPDGGALMVARSGIDPVDAAAVRLRAGALEGSNTDPAREMLGLVALTRQFESLSQVVQGYDAALGRAIEKLGEI